MKRCNDSDKLEDLNWVVATIVIGDYSSISALLSEGSLPNFVRESKETRRKTGETSKNVTNCKQMLLSFTQDFYSRKDYSEVKYRASDQRERAVKPLRKGTRYFFFFYAVLATGGWVEKSRVILYPIWSYKEPIL